MGDIKSANDKKIGKVGENNPNRKAQTILKMGVILFIL